MARVGASLTDWVAVTLDAVTIWPSTLWTGGAYAIVYAEV